MKDINFNGWLKLSDGEKEKEQDSWNVYLGEGEEIIKEALKRFIDIYGVMPNLMIDKKPGIYHGGRWVITVRHPFIFDQRKLPRIFLGFSVRGGISLSEVPEEFHVKDKTKEYVWSPERFEKFVDRCADEIRSKLGNSDMARDEMLDALCFGNFKKHISNYEKWKKEKKIP